VAWWLPRTACPSQTRRQASALSQPLALPAPCDNRRASRPRRLYQPIWWPSRNTPIDTAEQEVSDSATCLWETRLPLQQPRRLHHLYREPSSSTGATLHHSLARDTSQTHRSEPTTISPEPRPILFIQMTKLYRKWNSLLARRSKWLQGGAPRYRRHWQSGWLRGGAQRHWEVISRLPQTGHTFAAEEFIPRLPRPLTLPSPPKASRRRLF